MRAQHSIQIKFVAAQLHGRKKHSHNGRIFTVRGFFFELIFQSVYLIDFWHTWLCNATQENKNEIKSGLFPRKLKKRKKKLFVPRKKKDFQTWYWPAILVLTSPPPCLIDSLCALARTDKFSVTNCKNESKNRESRAQKRFRIHSVNLRSLLSSPVFCVCPWILQRKSWYRLVKQRREICSLKLLKCCAKHLTSNYLTVLSHTVSHREVR